MHSPAKSASGRGRAALLVAALLLGGLFLLRFVPPEGSPLYPNCPLERYTGLLCPGCGGLRALHELTLGRFWKAVEYNALLVVALPAAAAVAGLRWKRHLRRDHPGRTRTPLNIPRVALTVTAIFFLARNLPFEPFLSLVP